jgi:hypothetical protein
MLEHFDVQTITSLQDTQLSHLTRSATLLTHFLALALDDGGNASNRRSDLPPQGGNRW